MSPFPTRSGPSPSFLGNGNGTFAAAVNYPAGSSPSGLASGDFDGDGKRDLAVANSGGNGVSILRGNGNGTFAAPIFYSGAGSGPFSLVTADFNRDGRSDLALTNFNSNDESVFINLSTCASVTSVVPGSGLQPVARPSPSQAPT